MYYMCTLFDYLCILSRPLIHYLTCVISLTRFAHRSSFTSTTMVVTQKNRSELERELEAAERELSQLQAQHKAQQIEGGVGAGDDEDEDDDDVDVGFNDEELEALL